MSKPILPGTKGREETTVNRMITAAAIKDGLAEVFGTPFLVMLMENASVDALAPFLEDGEGSVGVSIDLRHEAATPIGMRVWAEAKIIRVEQKRIFFCINAFDEKGSIGAGTHERAIIRSASFMERVRQKSEC